MIAYLFLRHRDATYNYPLSPSGEKRRKKSLLQQEKNYRKPQVNNNQNSNTAEIYNKLVRLK